MLATPAIRREPASFGAPPEPALSLAGQIVLEDPAPVATTLTVPRRQHETAILSDGGLPEPLIPETRIAVKEAADVDVGADYNGGPVEAPEMPAALIEAGDAVPAPGSQSLPQVQTAEPAAAASPERPGALQVAAEQEEKVAGATKTLSFRPGETITIALEGRGWIFTGAAGENRGIGLLSRTITAGETVFRFAGASAGQYVLDFQIQDNQSGTISREGVVVMVEEAQPEAPVVVDAGRAPSAETPPPILPPSNLAQAADDPKAAVAVLGELLSSVTPIHQEELGRIAAWYKAAGYLAEYAMCLERYVKVFPNRWDNDFRYYELGRLYETDALRNERKARQYYAAVVDLYPASLYYLDAAKRVRYLDRHFLNLR